MKLGIEQGTLVIMNSDIMIFCLLWYCSISLEKLFELILDINNSKRIMSLLASTMHNGEHTKFYWYQTNDIHDVTVVSFTPHAYMYMHKFRML